MSLDAIDRRGFNRERDLLQYSSLFGTVVLSIKRMSATIAYTPEEIAASRKLSLALSYLSRTESVVSLFAEDAIFQPFETSRRILIEFGLLRTATQEHITSVGAALCARSSVAGDPGGH